MVAGGRMNNLSMTEASKKLGVCTATLRKLIARGQVKAVQFVPNGKFHIPETEITKLLAGITDEKAPDNN